MRSVSFLHNILRILHRAENACLLLLFLALVGIIFAQVLSRNFFDTGIIWAEVAVRTLVLWLTIFGAMVATRQQDHIRIDLVPRLLQERHRHFLRSFYLLVASGVAFAVVFYSFKIIQLEWAYPAKAFAEVPTWLAQAVIPFGFAVIGLRFLSQGMCAFLLAVKANAPKGDE